MLSKTLKELRKREDITQAELARILGITQQAVARWERNKSDPDIGMLEKLAIFFNVSPNYLIGWTPCNEENYSDDEKILIRDYRSISQCQKQTVTNLISFFKSSQGASTNNIIQNNTKGHNLYSNSGDNIVLT